MTVLISGGHLTPALAFIDEIRDKPDVTRIVFVGRESSKYQEFQQSQEKIELTARNLEFVSFSTGKLSSWNPIVLVPAGVRFMLSLFRAFFIVMRVQPTVFVSFGSYMAVPLAIVSWLLRVPVITHEQTRTTGFATAFIAQFANAVAISYPETKNLISHPRVVVTGNPLRPALKVPQPTMPHWLNSTDKPILYITGGSQGSETINAVVAQALPKLTRNWTIIHQCGRPTSKRNYAQELERARLQLSQAAQRRYFIREWVTQEELAWLYQNVTALISRAGANTVAEVRYFGVPALFIPLPFSHKNEQFHNAAALQQAGQALLIEQKQLTPETLLEQVEELKRASKHIQLRLKQDRSMLDTDAADRLYTLVQQVTKQ